MNSEKRTPDREPALDRDQVQPKDNADAAWGARLFVVFWVICVSLALVVGLLNAVLNRLYP